MSWQEARAKAEQIYKDLQEHHDYGFRGMVIDALQRLHQRGKSKPPKPGAAPKSEGKD